MFDRWREGVNADIEREAENREEERARREQVQQQTTQGWVQYFEDRLAEERRFTIELLNEAFPTIIGDLWGDIEKEVKQAIRLAFLERAGWTPRIRGTWVETEKYQALDLVARDGTIWLCKHSDPGECPGESWQLVSQRGERGKPGPIGPRGEQGPQGPRGEPGVNLNGWLVEGFRITPILGGGVPGPMLDLRPLFQKFLDEQANAASAKIAKATKDHHVFGQPPLVALVHGLPPSPAEEELA